MTGLQSWPSNRSCHVQSGTHHSPHHTDDKVGVDMGSLPVTQFDITIDMSNLTYLKSAQLIPSSWRNMVKSLPDPRLYILKDQARVINVDQTLEDMQITKSCFTLVVWFHLMSLDCTSTTHHIMYQTLYLDTSPIWKEPYNTTLKYYTHIHTIFAAEYITW